MNGSNHITLRKVKFKSYRHDKKYMHKDLIKDNFYN